MTNSYSPLNFAVATAKEAGEILLEYSGTELTKKINLALAPTPLKQVSGFRTMRQNDGY